MYVGNSIGEQRNHFSLVLTKVIFHLGRLGFHVQEESLTLTDARNRKLSVADIVDWLLGSHIHFVITHPHQGMWSSGGSVEEIYKEFARLKYHPGFPMGGRTHCPIFTQDKWQYLEHLSALSIHKSCKVVIPPESDNLEEVESQVRR